MAKKPTKIQPKPGQIGIEGIGVDIPVKLGPVSKEYDAVHASMHEWLGARGGSKREAYRGNDAQKRKPEVERPLTKMSLAEEVLIAKNELGFHPMSPLEAMQIMYLLPDLGKKNFSTTRYLASVMGRQKKVSANTIDPARAAHRQVREFGNHAADAKMTRIITQRFLDYTEEVNPKLKIKVLNYELPIDFSLPLARAHAVRNSVIDATLSPNPFHNMGEDFDNLDYMSDELKGDLLERVVAFNAIMTVKGARDIAIELMAEQDPRESFWNERVDESYRFTPVRSTVDSIRGVLPHFVYTNTP